MRPPVVLVVAKAPVVGRVKTRLGKAIGMQRAAALAAAALLDTLAACATAFGPDRCHLALDGDLADGERADDLLEATDGWHVHRQHGDGFAERLLHAHRDVATAAHAPVVQVGMDTPQLDARVLVEAGERLTHPDAAVLGPAYDGGWWLLGVGGPHLLDHLTGVPMSTASTGELTQEALARAGAEVSRVLLMRDVDELADADHVARAATSSRFARAYAELVR